MESCMKLTQLRCTNCGFPATLDLTQKQHTCETCKSSFVTVQAHLLDTKSEAEIGVVKTTYKS